MSDAEVNAQLKMLQKNLAKLEKISETRPAAAGDHVLIDFEGFQGRETLCGYAADRKLHA